MLILAEQTYLAIQFHCKNSKSLCVQIQFSANWVIVEFSEIHNEFLEAHIRNCLRLIGKPKLLCQIGITLMILMRTTNKEMRKQKKWHWFVSFFVSVMKYLPCKLIRSAIRGGINQTLGMILGLRRGKKIKVKSKDKYWWLVWSNPLFAFRTNYLCFSFILTLILRKKQLREVELLLLNMWRQFIIH